MDTQITSQEPTKVCRNCKEIKSLSEFSKCKNNKDGLLASCKKCYKKSKDKNKERLLQKYIKFQLENPIEKITCIECGQEKGLGEFHKEKRNKDGFGHKCKNCVKESEKKNIEKRIQEYKKYQHNNPINEKFCITCKKLKTISEFYKREDSKDGYRNDCIVCNKQQNYWEHPEENRLKSRQWYKGHKEERKLKQKQWRKDHPEESKLRDKKYNSKPENKEKHKLWGKQWYEGHKEEHTLWARQWRTTPQYLEHAEERRVVRRKYEKHRRETDSSYRCIKNLRSLTNQACKRQGVKKTMHTLESLGCTALEYQIHLQSHFMPGMTKENNGKRKWQQHHIIGFDDIDLRGIEQLKKVCHHTNIIPIWEDDHKALHGIDFKKRNKIIKKYNLEKYYL